MAVVQPTAQWLEQDPTYNSQLAALVRAQQNRQAADVQQRGAFDTRYNQGLSDLGWNPGTNQWNQNDLLTTSGAATRGQMGDFASRGMLQSSGYGEAQDNLGRAMNTQLSTAAQGRQDFLDTNQQNAVTFKDTNMLQQTQVKADALARRAAQYGG